MYKFPNRIDTLVLLGSTHYCAYTWSLSS